MSYRIVPLTPAGERVITAASDLIEPFQARADAADRANEICAANYADMQRSGVAAAFVPEELGGLGLRSMHDWILTIATLAKGDGSAAIAISMHLSTTRGQAALYRASEAGSPPHLRAQRILEAVAKGEMLICSTTTERGTDNLHPLSEAVWSEAGWILNGAKHFVTMSPLATHVATNVRMRDADGDHIANVLLPMNTEGVQPQGDWDALGMRASGSQSIKFENCLVPHDALRKIGPWGKWSTPVLVNRTLANAPLVAAFLGIAEAAFQYALDAQSAPSNDRAKARPGVHHALAEMEISLSTAQSIMARHGAQLDDFMAATNGGATATYEQGHELMKDYQSAKWVVNRHAIDIVSQAMDLSGGGGFLARNPLSRLYRDVRAGPFMQPYSPIDAREYMGKVILGAYPET
ncbi:MAG: acyl-CoA dehydrogenase family protein [Rhodospirillaceae bacterium]|jgi:alkylation response protein AidB-like acyl-CoA dehydrogenase|nr:acyl-CoA dehydrogenase family protein [Rhodospirillaceae bacterium]MBT5667368.1 acyl-CoA dehydrogenase family protein [Rhodospirillaceae bacterium]MBT5812523.1 acyl-CoA dehydrogenase family protein [Rhodospirillaceae bacterium]